MGHYDACPFCLLTLAAYAGRTHHDSKAASMPDTHKYSMPSTWLALIVATTALLTAYPAGLAEEAPAAVKAWLVPQLWERDAGPVVSLGEEGAFDDTHLFAPAVVRSDEEFWLYYCGSQGTVGQRVFQLGLSTSSDGVRFTKLAANPVYAFGDGRHSVLTPTLLRTTEGQPILEQGRWQMWFSATHFAGSSGRHTLHRATSADSKDWSAPSKPLLDNVYAPTILKQDDVYHLWYTDVSNDPWIFRHAVSADGDRWEVDDEPVLKLDQAWEQGRLFYPTVIAIDGVYLMWYGSYWSKQSSKTALGFAASVDGRRWFKHAENPVFRPDPSRDWESHYTTSQSVIRLADGSLRMWYASRTRPPFVHKYFAIGSARWSQQLPPTMEPNRE